jgi:AraC-like DNA-binding protein
MLLPASDPLDDALEDLHVSGSVLLHESYARPWAISVPNEDRLRELLGVPADVRILVFHFVRCAQFDLHIHPHAPVTVREAELSICPGGAAHVMSGGSTKNLVPLEVILRGGGLQPVPRGTEGATELVCGVFYVRAAPLNPMLAAMPPLIHVATNDASDSPMLANVAAMLAHEIDRGALKSFSAGRLLEVFCAEAIRAYHRRHGNHAQGWFKGLSDPRISEAIRQIHADPSQSWSVDHLAALVALSPSRFAARFREATGQSVMSYVAAWRVNVACRMLRDTSMQMELIAERVGYGSLPAFSRAFKTLVGIAPTAWRDAGATTISASADRPQDLHIQKT